MIFLMLAVDGAEAVVDESDAGADGLDGGRQDGDPLLGHVDGGAEEPELFALQTLFGELPLQEGVGHFMQEG